jgi:Flp pilus assembly pilin Flp
MKAARKRTPGRKKRWWRRLRRNQRGQSMVEYAIIASCILGGLTAMSIIFLPTMIKAYDIYYKSFYVILNLPIP